MARDEAVTSKTKLEEELAKAEFKKKSAEEELTSVQKKNTNLEAEVIQLRKVSSSNAESTKGCKAQYEQQDRYLFNFFHDLFSLWVININSS